MSNLRMKYSGEIGEDVRVPCLQMGQISRSEFNTTSLTSASATSDLVHSTAPNGIKSSERRWVLEF